MSLTWVLEETPQPGVYQLAFFGADTRRRARAPLRLALFTALVGTLDQFEELGRVLLEETAARRTEGEAAG